MVYLNQVKCLDVLLQAEKVPLTDQNGCFCVASVQGTTDFLSSIGIPKNGTQKKRESKSCSLYTR